MSDVQVTQANQFLRTFAKPLIATDVAANQAEFEYYRDDDTSSYEGQIVYIEDSDELHVITDPGRGAGAGDGNGSAQQIPLGAGSVGGGGGVDKLADLKDVKIAGGKHEFDDTGSDGVKDYKVVTLNDSGLIPTNLLEGLNVGKTFTSTADDLATALNDTDITNNITESDTLIVDSDNTSGTGAISYHFSGANAEEEDNYIPLGATAGNATTEIAGLVELATESEAESGGTGAIAVTPPVMRAHIIGTLLNNGVTFGRPNTVPSSASLAVGLTKADADLIVEDSAGYTNLTGLLQNESRTNAEADDPNKDIQPAATIWWDDDGTEKMYQWTSANTTDGPKPIHDTTAIEREDTNNWEMLDYQQNGKWGASTDMSVVDGRFHFGGTGTSRNVRLGDVGGDIGGLPDGYTIHHGDRVEDVLKKMLFPPAASIGWLNVERGNLTIQGAVKKKGSWHHFWADTDLSLKNMTVEYIGPWFYASDPDLDKINYGGTPTTTHSNPRMQNLNGSSEVTHADNATSRQSDGAVDFQNTGDVLPISKTSDIINDRSLSVSVNFDHDAVTVTYERLGTPGRTSSRSAGTIEKDAYIVGTYPVYYVTNSNTITTTWGHADLTSLEYTDDSTPRSATDFAGPNGNWVANGSDSDIASRTAKNNMTREPLFRENGSEVYADGGAWHGSAIVYPAGLVTTDPEFTVKSGTNQTIRKGDNRLRILNGTVTINKVDYKVAICSNASLPTESTLNQWKLSGIDTA